MYAPFDRRTRLRVGLLLLIILLVIGLVVALRVVHIP